ncbi:MAG TPA: MFS transporter, partial [Sphingobium sp.]|nr:MFS transporter [Sphingobium sp.]
MTITKEVRQTITGTAFYCAGGLIFTVMPAYLGGVGRALGVDAVALGTLSAVELWAIALASLTGPLWINRFDRRALAALGAVIALVGQCLTLFLSDYWALLSVRAATGLLGEGVLLTLSYALLGQTQHPERSFGIAFGTSIILGTLCLYMGPELDKASGTSGAILILAALELLALALCAFASLHHGPEPSPYTKPMADNQRKGASLSVGAFALVGQAVWYAGAGGFWSFTEQMASLMNILPVNIAHALGIGTSAALLGTFVTVTIGDRFGRMVPVVISTLLIALSVFAFARSSNLGPVTLELAIFNIFWASGTIYATAAACSIDEKGRIAVLVPAFQVIGMAIGTS